MKLSINSIIPKTLLKGKRTSFKKVSLVEGRFLLTIKGSGEKVCARNKSPKFNPIFMVQRARMLAELDWVAPIFKGITDETLEAFGKVLNAWIAKDPEFRSYFGFENKQYSEQELQDIATQIVKEVAEVKANIKIKEIAEIPEDMIQAFVREADGGTDYIRKVRKSNVKFSSFHEKKIVGFVSANYFSNVLSIHAIYVEPDYRRMGIAQQLIYKMVRRARQDNLEGVDVDEMLWATKWMLQKLKERWERKKDPLLQIVVHEYEEGFYAEIRFLKKKWG